MEKYDVVLINPPSTSFRRPEENLGFGYLSAVLRANGYKVKIIDAYLGDLRIESVLRELSLIKIKIFGFSIYQDSFESFCQLANSIKKRVPDSVIVAGGHFATFSYKDLLQERLVDIVVRGEGEETFVEVVKNLLAQNSLRTVNGIAYTDSGKIVLNEPRELIFDLDTLPCPDRDTIESTIERKAFVHISSSRGCYGNCSFCSINSIYKISPQSCSKIFSGWRGRSNRSVVDEIEYLNVNFGAKNFKFVDDCFFSPDKDWKARAIEFSDLVIEKGLKINFRISARVNNIDKIIFEKLKKNRGSWQLV